MFTYHVQEVARLSSTQILLIENGLCRDRFNWDQAELLEYNTYNFLLMVIGQFICFPFLVKVIKIPLMLIGRLTCVSRGGYYGMLASCSR